MAKKLKGPDGQYPTGKAKVGAILSKVGLIIGIVTTIIAIIWSSSSDRRHHRRCRICNVTLIAES